MKIQLYTRWRSAEKQHAGALSANEQPVSLTSSSHNCTLLWERVFLRNPSFHAVGALKFGVNRLLSISVSRYAEIVLKNVLSRSKNTSGTNKFAMKLSSGHERVPYTEILLKNVLRGLQNVPGTLRFVTQSSAGYQRVEYTEIVIKNVLSGSKNPTGTLKFARKLSSWSYIEIVLKNVFSRSENTQVHSNSQGSYLPGMNVLPYTEIVLKTVISV